MNPRGTVLNLRTTTSQKYEAVPSGLVFKAHRLVYHSTLGSRVLMQKKKKKNLRGNGRAAVDGDDFEVRRDPVPDPRHLHAQLPARRAGI